VRRGSGGFSERPARTCDLCGECGGIRRAALCGRGSTFAKGHLELRQAGASPSKGDRPRTRCRRAQRLTLAIYLVEVEAPTALPALRRNGAVGLSVWHADVPYLYARDELAVVVNYAGSIARTCLF